MAPGIELHNLPSSSSSSLSGEETRPVKDEVSGVNPVGSPTTSSSGTNTTTITPPSTRRTNSSTSTTASTTTPPSQTSTTTTSNPVCNITWHSIRKCCVITSKIFFATTGSVIAYLALSTAMWSSAKDFREDCRNQNETFGVMSQACAKALKGILSRPVGLDMFVSERKVDSQPLQRRGAMDTHHDTENGLSLLGPLLVAILAGCAFVYVLLHCAYKSLRRSIVTNNMTNMSTTSDTTTTPSSNIMADTIHQSTCTYPAWVPTAIPRKAGNLYLFVVADNHAGLRWRYPYTSRHMRSGSYNDDEVEGEWLPAGVSALIDTTYVTHSSTSPTRHSRSRSSSSSSSSSAQQSMHHPRKKQGTPHLNSGPATANGVHQTTTPFQHNQDSTIDDDYQDRPLLPISWRSDYPTHPQPAPFPHKTEDITSSTPSAPSSISATTMVERLEALQAQKTLSAYNPQQPQREDKQEKQDKKNSGSGSSFWDPLRSWQARIMTRDIITDREFFRRQEVL